MSVFSKVLGWAVGGFVFFSGLWIIRVSFIGGMILMTASMFYLPPTRERVYARTKRSLSSAQRGSAIAVAFLTALFFLGAASDKKILAAEQDKINEMQAAKQEKINDFMLIKSMVIKQVDKYIAGGDYDAARSTVKEYEYANDVDLMARKAIIMDGLAKNEAASLIKQAASVSSSDVNANLAIYERLVQLEPGNERYKKQLSHYRDLREEQAIEQKQMAERKKRISKQFSGWDGAHYGLERYVKERLKDPNSYDHIKTAYRDLGHKIFITTSYRAKNSFGGYVIERVEANADLNGNLLKVWGPFH
jgi:hypothetical protein